MADILKKKKVSELPEETNTTGFWIYGYNETRAIGQRSVRFAFDKIKSLFGVTQSTGQSTTLAPSQKLFTDELGKKADETNAQGKVVRSADGKIPAVDFTGYATEEYVDGAFTEKEKEIDEKLANFKEAYKTVNESEIDSLKNGFYKVLYAPNANENVEENIGYYYNNDGVLTKNVDDTAIAMKYTLNGATTAICTLWGSSKQASYHLIGSNGAIKSVTFPIGNNTLTVDTVGYIYLCVTKYTTRDDYKVTLQGNNRAVEFTNLPTSQKNIGYYYDDSGQLVKNDNDSAVAIQYPLLGAKTAEASLYGSSKQSSYHLVESNGKIKSVNFGSGLHKIDISTVGYKYLRVTQYTNRDDFNVVINYPDEIIPDGDYSDYYWLSQESKPSGEVLQTKWSNIYTKYHNRTKIASWSEWKKESSTIINVEGAVDYLTPNDVKEGSQIERINAVIQIASESGLKVVIPQKDSVKGSDVWLIDSAILLQSNTTLDLVNCRVKLSDNCRDNFMRTANLMPNQSTLETLYDIHVKGIGRVVFEGADNPRATGDWNKKLSLNPSGGLSYGTDAGKNENQYGGWLNHGINIVETERFSVQNIHLLHYHGHGFVMDRSQYGYVNNISFYATGQINGKHVTNQDGFGIRQGCRNITVENCTGTTGDDFMNIGCLLYDNGTSDHKTGNQNTHNPSGDIYRGTIDDTFNIIVQNIKGVKCLNGTRVLRLMCSNKQNQYNITVQNVKCDTAGYISFTQYQVSAGNNYLYCFNDISNNVYFEAESGVTVKNSTFQNIVYTGSKVVMSNISESNGNVFSNVRKV